MSFTKRPGTSISSSRPRKKLKTEVEKEEKIKNEDTPDFLEAETEPVQYHCDYCRKDISNSVRISCAVCLPDFDLCLECFSVGVELRGHENWHDYRVIDNMHFPFLTRDWSAEEEQLLLEGLELYGIGNWADVAEHVSTKDKAACRGHYEKYYLSSPTWPLPDYSHVLCTREKVKLLNSGKYNKIKRREGIVVKKEIVQKLKAGPKKNQQPKVPLHAKSPIHPELNGYMPLRDEFETEWDNDCENKMKDLIFLDDEPPEETAIKMKILEIHNYRLICRKKMKEFVVGRNLHDSVLQAKLAKNRNKEQREVHKTLKRFIQILNPAEYEEFIRGLARERQLKHRIGQLQGYRKKGICTLEDVNEYEEEKKHRVSHTSHTRGNNDGKSHTSTQNKPANSKLKPLDLEGHPGVDVLSDQERELCEHCHLLPQDYVLIKEALLREYVKTGELAPLRIEQLVGIVPSQDFVKLKAIFDFMQQVGWINNRHHTMAQPPGQKKPKSPAPGSTPTSPPTTSTPPTTPMGVPSNVFKKL